MGTRRSKHNRGRKARYKDHHYGLRVDEFGELVERGDAAFKHHGERASDEPRFYGGAYLNNGLRWSLDDCALLARLASSNSSVEQAAAVLGRAPKTIASRARDFNVVAPDDWRVLVKPKYVPRPRQPLEILAYPYIKRATSETADVLRVNELVPKSLPDWQRADICQDIMLAILERRVSFDELERNSGNIRYFLSRYYKAYNPWQERHFLVSNDDDRPYDEIAAGRTAEVGWRTQYKSYHAASQEDEIYEKELSSGRTFALLKEHQRAAVKATIQVVR